MRNYSEPLLNGFNELLAIAAPAAGAQPTQLLANGATYELLALSTTLVADATVINRFIRLSFLEAGNIFLALQLPTALTAGNTATIFGAQGTNGQATPLNTEWVFALPLRLTMPANYNITFSTLNMQAGDQYGATNLLVRKWVNQTV